MKKLLKNILIILSLVNLFNCHSKNNFEEFKINGKIPDQVADSIYIKTYEDSLLINKLYAVQIKMFNKEKKTIADTFHLTTFTKDGKIKSTLSANKGTIENSKKTLTAEGNVVFENESGILKTEYLIQSEKDNSISAPGKFTLIRENNILKGKKLLTDKAFNRIEMENVSAKGKINEKDFK